MPDSPLSDDELISSYLDNEVTSDERALVENRLAAEPAFAARVRELQGAASLAATPVTPLSAAVTDDLIGAALAASTTTAANVTDLAAAGARRGRSAWKGKLVAAAAVAAALVIAIPVVNNLSDDDTEDFATSADSADDSGDSADDGFAADSMVEEMGDADSAGEAETSAAYAEGDDMAADGDAMDDDMADDMDDLGDEDTAAVEGTGDDSTADDGADPTTTTGAGSLTTARARLSAALSIDDDSVADTFLRLTPAVADFVTSDDALDSAQQQWTAFVDRAGTTGTVPPSSLNGADLDQLDDLARVRLDELGACATLLERLRDHVLQLPGPPLVDDADVARITVDGRPATLVVVAFVSDTAEAVLIPDDTCVVEASRSLG